ncbi:MAG: glycosyltransferase [Ilyomonas sp.]
MADVILEPKHRIAILVPAYKEDNVILSTAHNLLNLNYPVEFYDVYIIADSFKAETLKQLAQLPVNLIEVSFEESTKAKALNKAFETIKKNYHIALICDADNMLSKDFLKKINNVFVDGAKAVQGRRVAKNMDTSFAILDGSSEAINNHIFRKGANAVGLSASLIGSGMAFQYDLVKEIMSEINAVGGFDKMLQLKVVQKGVSIEYLDNAFVFDEKVDSPLAFRHQRKRWVSSQFIYLNKFFLTGIKELFKGNFNYFNLAILNNILLPKVFIFLLLALLAVFAYLVAPQWLGIILFFSCIYVISVLLAIPPVFLNRRLLKAMRSIPKATFMMVRLFFQIRKANKTFIHTIHTKNEISTSLFNDNGN